MIMPEQALGYLEIEKHIQWLYILNSEDVGFKMLTKDSIA